jgi:excisionase family DNA binding protein
MPPGLRVLIVAMVIALVLLSIPPLRRRVPIVRGLPQWLDLVAWVALVLLCLSALADVETAKSMELSQSLARAALVLAAQSLGSALASMVSWVFAHQAALILVTVGAISVAWAAIAARFAAVARSTHEPHPRLGDWWLVQYKRRSRPPVQLRAAVPDGPAPFMDAGAAAEYAGVSRATLYRWARAGRISCAHAGGGMRFSKADLARLRGGGRTKAVL